MKLVLTSKMVTSLHPTVVYSQSSQLSPRPCGLACSLAAASPDDVCAHALRDYPAAWPCSCSTGTDDTAPCHHTRRSRGDAASTSSDISFRNGGTHTGTLDHRMDPETSRSATVRRSCPKDRAPTPPSWDEW